MNNTIKYILDYESVLILSIILLSILNLFINYNYQYRVLSINVILIGIYFILSKKTNINKLIIFVTMINFSLWGTLIEYLIIRNTNLLKYNNINKNIIQIPYWLFTVYCIFLLGALYTFDLITKILN
jgi:hypothetical protein